MHVALRQTTLVSVSRWRVTTLAQRRHESTTRLRQRVRPSDPFAASLCDEDMSPSLSAALSSQTNEQEALSRLRTHAAALSPPAEWNTTAATRDAMQALDVRAQTRMAEQQAALMAVSAVELVERVQHYLNATRRVHLVSAEEEHALFPIVNERLEELSVDQILDIVSCHWSRSTLVRYGTALKDRIRDRIALIAVHAGQQLQQKSSLSENSEPADTLETEASASSEEDVVMAAAAATMDAATVLRCLTVMGISAGHRKRDVEYFQVIGSFLVFHINRYRDSQDLVRALTALSRAKIVPPQSFLGLLARRLPVLNKTTPLSPLSAYRVMVNLSKMGYKHMNVYRFLADSMLHTMQKNIESLESSGTRRAATDLAHSEVHSKGRVLRVTELKPSMFTKWLSVLGLTGAPHQQYLRPLVTPLIVPSLPSLPPPSFSRLLVAVHRFRSTDPDLLEPLLTHMATQLAPAGQLRRMDALLMLRILTRLGEEAPPGNTEPFFRAVQSTFGSASTTLRSSGTPMRPRNMCTVAKCVVHYQSRTSMPLESLAPLLALLEDFAAVLCGWIELGVVSLMHVDQFLALCLQHIQHPDENRQLARLQSLRQHVEASTQGEHDRDEGEKDALGDDYDGKLDIDVREVFDSLTLVNDAACGYGGFRPIPGPLLVDFRELLARCTILDVMQAVDLFEQSCPGALAAGTKLVVTRSALAKLTQDGEEVMSAEGHELILRAPQALVLTRDDLTHLVSLLRRTPLEKVRESAAVWSALRQKAQQLGMDPEQISTKTE